MRRFGKLPLNLIVLLSGLVCISLTDLASAYSNLNLVVSSNGASVVQESSYSNTYTSYSRDSATVNAAVNAAEHAAADAVANAAANIAQINRDIARTLQQAGEAVDAVANSAANTALINRHIARTLQQTGEAVRRSLQKAHQDFIEAFRSAGFWGK